jgi:twitching motility protein PilT
MAFDKTSFHKLLHFCVEKSVSDIHLREGEVPYIRMKGDLKKITAAPLTPEDMKFFCQLMFGNEDVMKNYDTIKEHDCSYQFENLCRVRVHYLKFQKRSALILRLITMVIPTLEQLKLPVAISKMTNMKRGLILITGVTGSGKSSTMAAMLEEINMTREEHILTIEDPVEFLFVPKKCRITQREVGDDTASFQVALRGALRQDPDIIVIGELRDAETIQIAIKAAETGHLVFGTVHTTNAQSTINRVVSMFSPEEQNNVKLRLADCLAGTVSQRLLPTLDGKGRVCAQEIMVNTIGVKDAISGREPLSSMYLSIELGKQDEVSQSFDQHLTDLYLNKIISHDVARDAASSPSNFERNLEFGQAKSSRPRIVNKNANNNSEEAHDQEESQNEQSPSLSSNLMLEEKKKA